jgi:uncharacterized membrane protein HdeD (DUF308 family)
LPPRFPLVGLDEVRRHWAWFLVLGIGLILLGMVAVGAAVVTTKIWVVLFGWLLLFGGIFEATLAFRARQWNGFILQLLVGIMNVVIGVLIVWHPLAAAAGLTLLLAALLLTTGVFRAVAAASQHYPNWGWVVLDGLVCVILGIMIWAEWPSSSLWVIGMFVGITIIVRGWSWTLFALAAKQLPAN